MFAVAKTNSINIPKFEYTNNRQKIDVNCLLCGHKWKTTYSDIMSGRRCYKCSRIAAAKKMTLSSECVRDILGKYDIVLLSGYSGLYDDIEVQCKCCHIKWWTYLQQIKRMILCPKCEIEKIGRKTRLKNQKLLFMSLYNIFSGLKILYNYRNFDWLTGKVRNREIDIWIPELKLAIEYDGEQHFRPVCFGGISLDEAKARLVVRKKDDISKRRQIRKHPEDIRYFVRFSYKEKKYLCDKEYIVSRLMAAGLTKEEFGKYVT